MNLHAAVELNIVRRCSQTIEMISVGSWALRCEAAVSPKRGAACLLFEYVPALRYRLSCYVMSPYDPDGSCSPSPASLLFSLLARHIRLGVGWLVLHDIAGSSVDKQREDSDMAPLPAKSSKRHATGLDRRQDPINVH